MNDRLGTATYSPEDNKLRLYPEERLSPEDFARVKAHGFKWAPKQELFVKPRWTPRAEDFLLEICGEITPEESTLADRAEQRAERFDNYREKRLDELAGFSRYAAELSERFDHGQPILVGHHSERSARRDQKRMDSAMRHAQTAARKANYWSWKAEGVERYANMKIGARTIQNRIKKLLAELRTYQRRENLTAKAIKLWSDLLEDEPGPDSPPWKNGRGEEMPAVEAWQRTVEKYVGAYTNDGRFAPDDMWERLTKEEPTRWNSVKQELEKLQPVTHREACQEALEWNECPEAMIHNQRWIAHFLGRLSFETSQLGAVPRFEGEITPGILQVFCRTFGADKPKAKFVEGNSWEVTSLIEFPPHISPGYSEVGKTVEATADQWKDLMQALGYTVPPQGAKAKSAKARCPLLNYDGEGKIHCTKAQWAGIHKDYKGTTLSECKTHRIRHAMKASLRAEGCDVGEGYGLVEVFIVDSKAHPKPEASPKPEAEVV